MKMGIAEKFPEYVKRHIKKKMKKKVIETHLSNFHQMIRTQANPLNLDLESRASSQQIQGEQVKPSQPR